MVIEMRWNDRGAIGVLHIPSNVSDLTEGTEFESVQSGEALTLAIALGLGVIFAGLAGTHLVLSGEKTAWQESWGSLLDLPAGLELPI